MEKSIFQKGSRTSVKENRQERRGIKAPEINRNPTTSAEVGRLKEKNQTENPKPIIENPLTQIGKVKEKKHCDLEK